jgi:hypothetical protein
MHTYGTAANQLTIDTMADHKYNIHSSTCMHVNSVTSMHYVRARTSLTNSTRRYFIFMRGLDSDLLKLSRAGQLVSLLDGAAFVM